jgi:hypothetical protein
MAHCLCGDSVIASGEFSDNRHAEPGSSPNATQEPAAPLKRAGYQLLAQGSWWHCTAHAAIASYSCSMNGYFPTWPSSAHVCHRYSVRKDARLSCKAVSKKYVRRVRDGYGRPELQVIAVRGVEQY